MTAQLTSLSALIEAVGRGTFLLGAIPSRYENTTYQAFSGSHDAAKALRDALGVIAPIEEDARDWLLSILRAYRAKIGGDA